MTETTSEPQVSAPGMVLRDTLASCVSALSDLKDGGEALVLARASARELVLWIAESERISPAAAVAALLEISTLCQHGQYRRMADHTPDERRSE